MRFEQVDTGNALGWSLAHSIDSRSGRLKKGTLLTQELVERLKRENINSLLAFRLDDGDIPENEAAECVARQIAGNTLKVGAPTRGRCNLYAEKAGLFIADRNLDDLNRLDPAVGIACLANFTSVRADQLVATIKIFPYGLERSRIIALGAVTVKLEVKAYDKFTASIISSGEAMKARAYDTTADRLQRLNGSVTGLMDCAHTVGGIAAALRQQISEGADLILLSGLSAISDERDILPEGLKAAGGTLIQLGMPVDPGNLLMLGDLHGTIVIGIPGCAKSPKLNGFDWVLERFAAGLPLTAKIIQGMGIGGLLKEITDRPSLRAPRLETSPIKTAAIILAAGRSSRSGENHKLLATLDKKLVIEQTVDALADAGLNETIVVTGHSAAEIAAALKDRDVKFVHNPSFQSGMASSLAAGISALSPETDQCFICLGDMPFVALATLSSLLDAANSLSEAEIFIPLYKGKHGNPVLWRRSLFEQLSQITGDKGGRAIIREQKDLVSEVKVDDPGVLIDLDTPEALAQFGIMATN